LIHRAHSLTAHDADFLGREVGLQQATELEFLFIEGVSLLLLDMDVETLVDVIFGKQKQMARKRIENFDTDAGILSET
jgi:hypothetical protein